MLTRQPPAPSWLGAQISQNNTNSDRYAYAHKQLAHALQPLAALGRDGAQLPSPNVSSNFLDLLIQSDNPLPRNALLRCGALPSEFGPVILDPDSRRLGGADHLLVTFNHTASVDVFGKPDSLCGARAACGATLVPESVSRTVAFPRIRRRLGCGNVSLACLAGFVLQHWRCARLAAGAASRGRGSAVIQTLGPW